jgi:hypothetical protein
MFKVVNLAVAACRAAARRRASRPLPYMSDYMLRDIGFTRVCVADGYGSRYTVAPFGPFGLPIVR